MGPEYLHLIVNECHFFSQWNQINRFSLSPVCDQIGGWVGAAGSVIYLGRHLEEKTEDVAVAATYDLLSLFSTLPSRPLPLGF